MKINGSVINFIICTLLSCNFIYLNIMNSKVNHVVKYVNKKREERLAEQKLFEYNKKQLEDISFSRVSLIK